MEIDAVCGVCGEKFKKNTEVISRKGSDICYACALGALTKGRCPEEGDFNSARLISREVSDEELEWLTEDLRSVEEGRSIRESYDSTGEEHVEPWCDICGTECYCDCCDECGQENPCLCEEN